MSVLDGLPGIFTDTFGEAVIVPNGLGGINTITAIVRTQDDEEDLFETATIRGSKVLHAKTVDIEHVKDGSYIQVGPVMYLAGNPMDDRGGMSKIPLRTLK